MKTKTVLEVCFIRKKYGTFDAGVFQDGVLIQRECFSLKGEKFDAVLDLYNRLQEIYPDASVQLSCVKSGAQVLVPQEVEQEED
jgi:ABC-type metal ion transport system substrate-binding protein